MEGAGFVISYQFSGFRRFFLKQRMNKSELRKTCLARQRSLSSDERLVRSRQISDHFFDSFDLEKIAYLHCFIAIEKFNEIDTTLIFTRLWKDFLRVQTLVPRVVFGTGEMQNLRFTPDTELVKNVWDIHEPSHDAFVEPVKIDMVLVPGLCFDKQGHRVGYGKGFYDRFLSQCRPDCLKIGLSYFEPVEQIDDIHEGDVTLDHVITPEAIFTPERQRREED